MVSAIIGGTGIYGLSGAEVEDARSKINMAQRKFMWAKAPMKTLCF
jgi:hypothetical protein